MRKILRATALVKRKSAIYFLLLPKIRRYLESLKIKFFYLFEDSWFFFRITAFF
jgi:hypothetical protein